MKLLKIRCSEPEICTDLCISMMMQEAEKKDRYDKLESLFHCNSTDASGNAS